MKELVDIQSKLKAPKGQFNKFGNYKYRSCEDILEALKPLLNKSGCQLTISDEIVPVGNRIYVKATVSCKNSNGEEVITTAYAREEESKKGMDASQVTGAASSYARKYALNGMFCIDDTKDSDTINAGGNELEDALKEIAVCNSVGALTTVYNKYISLHSNSSFMEALSSHKKQLKDGIN